MSGALENLRPHLGAPVRLRFSEKRSLGFSKAPENHNPEVDSQEIMQHVIKHNINIISAIVLQVSSIDMYSAVTVVFLIIKYQIISYFSLSDCFKLKTISQTKED